MTGWIIVALILINAVLLALCVVLIWLWLDQRKTTRMLARELVDVLSGRGMEERTRRWLRAIEGGDAAGLSPQPPGPDR